MSPRTVTVLPSAVMNIADSSGKVPAHCSLLMLGEAVPHEDRTASRPPQLVIEFRRPDTPLVVTAPPGAIVTE